MSILTCACYGRADILPGGTVVPVLQEETLLATIKVDFTSGAAKGGAAIPDGTQYLEIYADAACHWTVQLQSASAAADTADHPLGAGGLIYRRISIARYGDGTYGVSAVAAS